MQLSFDILRKNKDILNRINVFPIADGDTGKNLYNTLKDLENTDFQSLKDFLSRASSIAMSNGIGCSGNILSLFIMGMNLNCSENLSEMCLKASKFAWDTMYEPVEGTILTAMKSVPKGYESLDDFIYQYIHNTYDALMEGPDILPSLKMNRTLDSGTLGFLYILCDIYKCLTGKDISPDIDINEPLYLNDSAESRYCNEYWISDCDEDIREALRPLGSELICLFSKDTAKIHIHTDDYKKVYDVCSEYGNISSYKIEDMKDNNRRILIT